MKELDNRVSKVNEGLLNQKKASCKMLRSHVPMFRSRLGRDPPENVTNVKFKVHSREQPGEFQLRRDQTEK